MSETKDSWGITDEMMALGASVGASEDDLKFMICVVGYEFGLKDLGKLEALVMEHRREMHDGKTEDECFSCGIGDAALYAMRTGGRSMAQDMSDWFKPKGRKQ